MNLIEIAQLRIDILEAIKATGANEADRFAAVAQVLDGQQYDHREVARLVIQMYIAGRQAGRAEIKEQVARL